MRLQSALAQSGGQHDQTQVSLLDEVCLLVDHNDTPVGTMKKGECMLTLRFHRTVTRAPRPFDDGD